MGLSLRTPWIDGLLQMGERAEVDVLEVMLDDVLHGGDELTAVRRCASRWPVVGHGVALGVGSADGVNERYVQSIGAMLEKLGARWYSEHLGFVSVGGIEVGHFAPIDDSPEQLDALWTNAAQVRAHVRPPLLLENPADILGLSAADDGPTRARRFVRCLEAADAGALIDVTNLLYNARNDGFDPFAYIDALNPERVVQIHVAGGRCCDDLWIDSHDRPLEAEVLALLRAVVRRAPNLRAVTLEWDADLPPLEAVLEQLARVRVVVAEEGRR